MFLPRQKGIIVIQTFYKSSQSHKYIANNLVYRRLMIQIYGQYLKLLQGKQYYPWSPTNTTVCPRCNV